MKKWIIKTIVGILISLTIIFAAFVIVVISLSGARKPAIYLYPEEDSAVSIRLEIKGWITKTIPSYDRGWNVSVSKDGLIEGEYDYLFYEAKLLRTDFPKTGWVVKYEDLSVWFDLNLIKLGLNEKEKNQFKEYWMGALPKSAYYEIKLADENYLNTNMALDILPKPDTVIRLLFKFKPLKKEVVIPQPDIITPNRSGFTVVEWGGILDK